MNIANRSVGKRLRPLVVLGAVAALTMVAFTPTSFGAASPQKYMNVSGSRVPLTNNFGYKYGYTAAVKEVAQLYKGTNTAINTTPRLAATNKSIVIISAMQASISSSVPVAAAVAAATAIGWKVSVLDAQGNPANAGGLIDQAIAEGANGIILDSIDCNQAKAPLQQARAKGIAVVGLYSYDCNDPVENAGSPLFSAIPNFQNIPAKLSGGFTEAFGRGSADYIIAKSKNKARILVLDDPELVVLKYETAGFVDQINHSGGSRVVAYVNFLGSDLGPKLQQMIQAELLKHPDINWIKSSYTYASVLGIVPAIAAYPKGKFKVFGEEGLQPELQAVSSGTVTASLCISDTWEGWAAVDAMNSVFKGKKTYPSGVGWQLVDSTHNLPANGLYVPRENFIAAFEKAWGVTG